MTTDTVSSEMAAAGATRHRRTGGFGSLVPPMASALLFITLLLSVAAVRLIVAGIPVRAVFAFALLGLLLAQDRGLFKAVLREHPRAFFLILIFMALGLVVSLINLEPLADTARQLLEIHVQALVGLFIGKGMLRLVGPRALVTSFLVVILTTVVISVAQFLGMGPAWFVRRWLGVLQHDSPMTQIFYTRQDRTMGLSFSPVHLGTQACLGFAAFILYMSRSGDFLSRMRWEVLIALAIVIVTCLASGNRSPLLGIIAFGYVYLACVSPIMFLLACAAAVVVIPSFGVLQENLVSAGLRVAETDDGSAQGRGTLASYGVRLFLARPVGYGLGFASTDYWADYWQYLQYSANSQAVKNYALHNYFLLTMNKYGAAAIIGLIMIIPRSRRDFITLLAFIPYIFHIAFHNDGPLSADFLIWYILPLGALIPLRRGAPLRRPASWRRYVPAGAVSTQGEARS